MTRPHMRITFRTCRKRASSLARPQRGSPAVRRVAKFLKKCHGDSFKFPNFTQSRMLLRLARLETVQIEFAQACWLSSLFARRAPSETIRLQRAFRNDDIAAFSSQREGHRWNPRGSWRPIPHCQNEMEGEPGQWMYPPYAMLLSHRISPGNGLLPGAHPVACNSAPSSSRGAPIFACQRQKLQQNFARIASEIKGP